jgi:replicative DNA helicase
MRYLEQSRDAAASLIGWLLDAPEKLMEVTISPNLIHNFSLKEIFKAVLVIDQQSNGVSVDAVDDYLTKIGVDVQYVYLLELTLKKVNGSVSGDIQALEARIRTADACKKGYEVSALLIEASDRGDVMAMQEACDKIMSLGGETKNYDFSFSEMFDLTIQDALKQMEGGDQGKISTGVADIDSQIGGFHNGDLIILAARPAMGKTALMINMALGAGEGKKVGIMSGEQPKVQIGYRAFAIESGLAIGDLRKEMTEQSYMMLSDAASRLANKGGRIYEKPAPTIQDICAKAREWKYKYNIDAIYIDYLQRVKAINTSAPKHEQVAEIAMTLKELARTLDIPIIALAQVNRSVESRPDKRPGTGDIKDSGVVEQEADQILTLYRDDVYNEDTDDRGIAEIDVKKNRHGATGCIRVEWIARCLKFKGLAEHWNPMHMIPDIDQDKDQDDWKSKDGLWRN